MFREGAKAPSFLDTVLNAGMLKRTETQAPTHPQPNG